MFVSFFVLFFGLISFSFVIVLLFMREPFLYHLPSSFIYSHAFLCRLEVQRHYDCFFLSSYCWSHSILLCCYSSQSFSSSFPFYLFRQVLFLSFSGGIFSSHRPLPPFIYIVSLLSLPFLPPSSYFTYCRLLKQRRPQVSNGFLLSFLHCHHFVFNNDFTSSGFILSLLSFISFCLYVFLFFFILAFCLFPIHQIIYFLLPLSSSFVSLLSFVILLLCCLFSLVIIGDETGTVG